MVPARRMLCRRHNVNMTLSDELSIIAVAEVFPETKWRYILYRRRLNINTPAHSPKIDLWYNLLIKTKQRCCIYHLVDTWSYTGAHDAIMVPSLSFFLCPNVNYLFPIGNQTIW